MAYIDNYSGYCIYREFIDDDTLMILAYSKESKKFYQNILTKTEWENINSNFTLKELELIFKICIDKRNHYTITINNDNPQYIILSFVCMELIKTYKWEIKLLEKNYSDIMQIQKMFLDFKEQTDKKNTEINKFFENISNSIEIEEIKKHVYDYQYMIKWLLEELYNNIHSHYTTTKKELVLVPFIANIKNSFDNRFNENTLSLKRINSDDKLVDDDYTNGDEIISDDDTCYESDAEIIDDNYIDDENKKLMDKFIKNRITELKDKYPNLYSTQYLQMAVKEWNDRNK